MTAMFISSMRQSLRKRWVRCLACLAVLAIVYISSAGHVAALTFHPLFQSLPSHAQVRFRIFAFYGPVFAIGGSSYCPRIVSQFLTVCVGDCRSEVAWELVGMSYLYGDQYAVRDGLTNFALILDSNAQLPLVCGSGFAPIEEDDFIPIVAEAASPGNEMPEAADSIMPQLISPTAIDH